MKNVEFEKLEYLLKLERDVKKRQEYAKSMIKILKDVQLQFLSKAEERGYSLDSYNVLEIKLEQFKAMRQIAMEANISTNEFDKEIDLIMKTLWSENYKLIK